MYTLKKSLGQHFLKDKNICRKIAEEVAATRPHHLLEVGPGAGAITSYFLEWKDVDFRAVELDHEKVVYLQDHFPAIRGKLVEGSILDIPVPFEGPFTLVGNFPYNISSQILFRVLEWREQVEAMVGMFQKEVAVRVASPPGNKDYGILSVLIQAFFRVEYLFDVHENCFDPPPQVKSGVIRLVNAGNPYGVKDYPRLLRLVKAAFGQRRKQLRNPLKPYFKAEFLQEDIFTRRAEQLSVADFISLMPHMS
jgi:16S rRNA (adenine1518-N6/adenine1519-N6)-dimethyltransferase